MDQTEVTEAYRNEFRKIEIKKARGGFWAHLLLFSLTNLGVILYNIITEKTWFWYPLIIWSLILIVHLFNSVFLKSSTLRKREKQALDKLQINSFSASNN